MHACENKICTRSALLQHTRTNRWMPTLPRQAVLQCTTLLWSIVVSAMAMDKHPTSAGSRHISSIIRSSRYWERRVYRGITTCATVIGHTGCGTVETAMLPFTLVLLLVWDKGWQNREIYNKTTYCMRCPHHLLIISSVMCCEPSSCSTCVIIHEKSFVFFIYCISISKVDITISSWSASCETRVLIET
jgi:hypothetical protein